MFREQKPVYFEPIPNVSSNSAYTLNGLYGGYVTAGIDYLFISMAVGGAKFDDDSYVLSWTEIKEQGEETGKTEAFYCMSKYSSEKEFSELNETQSF